MSEVSESREISPISETKETPPVAPIARSKNGTFAPGNKFAKGNPQAAKVQKLRNTLLQAAKPAALKNVVKKLFETAQSGGVPAMKLLFDRLLGPPAPLDFEERLKNLEEQMKGTEDHAPQE